MLIRKLLHYHLLSTLCGIGILLLCTIKLPQNNEVELFPNFDKFVHFMMYFCLSGLILLETLTTKPEAKKRIPKIWLQVIVISAVLGGAIEFIQEYLTDYRSGDVLDFGADMAGALCACLITGLIRLASR